jgi:hypothetical protein
MAKVGRNHPCPCGSGKKFKLCCLPAQESDRAATAPEPAFPGLLQAFSAPNAAGPGDPAQLDELSNGVLDLIHERKFDDAEKMCAQLFVEFPDVFDGHMRLGQLHRARGDAKHAAFHLRVAAAMTRNPDHDPELALGLDAEADELDPQPA